MIERPTLWDWARRTYAAPGVQELCLELQDAHAQSVCLALWAGWAASVGHRPDAATLSGAIALARVWQGEIVDPLRGVRRRLKTLAIAGPWPEALYVQAKALELEAERALLTALEAWTPVGAAAPAEPVAAMADACAAWGDPPPRARLEALAAAFPAG